MIKSLVACALAAFALLFVPSGAAAASVALADGQPDPNSSDLNLWLRADAGVKDEAGRGPDDAAFSGLVAAWHDQSPRHFDLTALADRAPMYVPRQPGAGGRPAVAFGAGRLLARTTDDLHTEANSTTLIVLQVQPGNQQGNTVYCAGEPNGRGERLIFSSMESSDGVLNNLRWLTPAGNGQFFIDDPLRLPADGRFAIAVIHAAGENSTVEIQDGLGDAMGGNRQIVPRGMMPRSNAGGRGLTLGGIPDQPMWSYGGQIAEMLVYRRTLTLAEKCDLVAYLRRKYALDVLDALAPDGVTLVQAEDFRGAWMLQPRLNQPFGIRQFRRPMMAFGPVAKSGIKRTVRVARAGNYAVWVRAIAMRSQSALRTLVNGKALGVTHAESGEGICWQRAGAIELAAGDAEIEVRGEGPGRKECDAALIGPADMKLDDVESYCALARRLRETPGSGNLSAVFADGRRIEGDLLSGWRGSGTSIGHEASRPALRCLTLGLEPSDPPRAALLEFQNGDHIRGTIAGAVSASPSGGKALAAQVLVQLARENGKQDEKPVGIDGDWLRRVVFDAGLAPRDMPPQSLVTRDGRFLAFRALRWTDDGASVLTSDGIRRIAYKDLAQVELASWDAWDAYYRQLAAIDPRIRGEIVRLETSDGAIVTASAAGSAAYRVAEERAASMLLLRPVWGRTPVSVAWSSVSTLWRAPATVVRLSQFAPRQVAQGAGLGGSWRWQADRSVAGGELASGGNRYLWGYGVHAPNSLTFALPEAARAVQTSVGIDASVGKSGYCVARVYANEISGVPLFQSAPLAGSRGLAVTGEIPLARGGVPARRLIFAVDGGGDSRPPSAGPLDIGDHVDWLEPVLILDEEKLREAVKKVREK